MSKKKQKGGRKALPAKDKKIVVSFRMSPTEIEHVEKAATKAGASFSEFSRNAVLKACGIAPVAKLVKKAAPKKVAPKKVAPKRAKKKRPAKLVAATTPENTSEAA